MVFDSTLDEGTSVGVLHDIKALLPAVIDVAAVVTLMVAELKSPSAAPVVVAGLPLLGAVSVKAFAGVSQSESPQHCKLVHAIILEDAVPEVDSRLVTVPGKARGVTRNSITAFVAAVVERVGTLRVFPTTLKLGRALCLDAILRSAQSQTMVLLAALSDSNSCLVTLTGEANLPAGLFVTAFLLAVLEGGLALGISLTGLPFVWALLFDAFLGVDSQPDDPKAVVLLAALGNSDGGFVSLASEAGLPARLFVTALLLAVLESGDALGVGLAGLPLLGALLFDALLGVDRAVSLDLDGRGDQEASSEEEDLLHQLFGDI